MKKLLLALLFCGSLFAQNSRSDGIVFSRSGNPAPGASIAVCSPVAITAASEVVGTVTITSTLNPAQGSTVQIVGMTPTQYNGSYTVLTTSGTNFTYTNPTQGLGAGTVFGTALVVSTSPCSPLAALCASFTDTTCTSPNPVTADGLGNYSFYVKPGRYTAQFYGSGLTARLQPDQVLACDPSSSCNIAGALTGCIINSMYVAGSSCYPTTQSAINALNALGTTGTVLIQPGLACSDAFTNTNNLLILDLRDCLQNTGTLRVWSRLGTVRNVTVSTGTFPLGNDLALEPAGAADLWFRQLNLAAVTTATTFNVGGATTVSVGSTANFSVNAPIQVAREQTSEEALTAQANCAAVVGAGNWSISDATHFCIWPANNHSGTTDIEQQGTGATSLRAFSLQPNNPAQLGGRNAPFRWQDVNLLTFMYWPINVVDTYPYNTVGLSVPLTGTSNATPTGHANLKLQNRTSSDAVQMLASGGGVTFQCTDSICNAGTTFQSWNGNGLGGYSDAGSTLKYNLNGNTGLMSTYSGTATQGQGVSWIPGITSQKAETQAADANVLTVTPAAAAGDYRVCFTASVSSATNGVIGWTLSWTDSNGNAQANIAESLFQQGTAAPALTFTVNAAGNYSSCTTIDVNNAAASIIVKWVGGGTTAAKVSATVERLI